MEAGLPDDDSAQSKEGTLLHSFDANPKLDRAVLKPQQQDLLRISAELDDFVFSRVREQFTDLEVSSGFTEGREKELIALRGTNAETPGHCDRFVYFAGTKLLVIIDKKFGYRETTPAAANYQLRTYAIGAAEEWDVDNVVVAITQPRLPYEQRVTMASYTREDIEASKKELSAIRFESAKPDAPLVAGEEQCRYCRARAFCPALKAKIDSGFSLVPVAGDGTVAKRQAEAAELLARCDDEELDRVLVAIQLSDFIKDPARDEARRRVEAGQLTTWQLGKASEIRKIVDSKRAVSLLSLRGDLTRDEVLGCCSPKIGALEEKLREKKKCTWKEAKEIVEETLAPVLERESKKQSLTRIKT
jgi:hypothetical protein